MENRIQELRVECVKAPSVPEAFMKNRKKIIAKEKTFDKPVDGDWIKLLLTENVIGVNHILLEKIS